jgi:putative SOS response-associated peptidase YedK
MCARYTLTKDAKALIAAYDAKVIDPFNPDYNIAPTDGGMIIRADHQDEIHNYHFGLVRWNDKDLASSYRNTNAKAENLLAVWKPYFVKNKRCLVLADGFYEWEKSGKDGKERLPWRFVLQDREVFAFAGLYSRWDDPVTQRSYHSFAIVTTQPNQLLEKYHNRMPVILHKDQEKLWLSNDIAPQDLISEVSQPFPDDLMSAYRVSKSVNSVVVNKLPNKGPELILPENSK